MVGYISAFPFEQLFFWESKKNKILYKKKKKSYFLLNLFKKGNF